MPLSRVADGEIPFGSWDGHTHTKFCSHGSQEDTRRLIARAVELGFQRYSLTEHPPLPAGFEDPAPTRDDAIASDELEPYLQHAERLRSEFADEIEVRVGLEVDYLSGWEADTRAMLEEVGPRLEDALLSVHFLPVAGGWRCIDHSVDDFRRGVLRHHGTVERVHRAYWNMVRRAVEADLGSFKPRRFSHFTLAHKFRRAFGEPPLEWTLEQVEPILAAMGRRGMALDVNASGLEKPHCRQLYPPAEVLALARRHGVGLVYGSDAHAVAGVGQMRDAVMAIVAGL